MTQVGRALSFGIALLVAVACGGAARRAEPVTELPAASSSPGAQPGYCARLQPLLTQAVTSARIGTQMACLDIPGVTELGRFGASGAGEEGALSDCFDAPDDYEKLLERSESDFDLSIDQRFSAEVGQGAKAELASLGALVPWMPSLSLDLSQTRRVTARVAVKHARFVTLLGVASRLQGQRREQQCLETLCKPEYQYVSMLGTISCKVEVFGAPATKPKRCVP